MAYKDFEVSIDSCQPIEFYLFSYNGVDYSYTSAQYPQYANIDGKEIVFNPDYIERGESLKLGDSGGTVETCTINVSRTNSIALLYQGAPPETDSVRLQVFRKHGEEAPEHIRILCGTVSSVRFSDSVAEITVTIENVLNRQIPKGTLSYHCQNCIYDDKCKLKMEEHAVECPIDQGMTNLNIYSSVLASFEEDYFTGGFLRLGNSLRAITYHTGNMIRIKYPVNQSDIGSVLYVYPGCGNIFRVCATRFHNTDNFNGIPYTQPYDAFKHPVGTGSYWVDSQVIIRDSHMKIKKMNL